MRIEEGKFYRTRDGRKIGPIEPWTHTDDWKWQGMEPGKKYGYLWDANGVNSDGEGSKHDLVAEWTEPACVRTVTRQEIIPGTYDGVEVGKPMSEGLAMVRFRGEDAWSNLTPDELDRAAAVLTALAGALRDGE